MKLTEYPYCFDLAEGELIKFSELAERMAIALHPGESDSFGCTVTKMELEKELVHQVDMGALKVRTRAGLGRHPFPIGAALLDSVLLAHDLTSLFQDRGISFRVTSSQTPVAVECEAPAALKGLTQAQILTAFGGLVSKMNLKKAMGDGATLWLLDARISKGSPGRGRHQAQWNPVILAVALYERGHATKRALSAAFFEHSFLADWREEWKEQEENLVQIPR